MLLIDAVYIHESGGKTLLEYFVQNLAQAGDPFCLLLDQRLESTTIESLPVKKYSIKASEPGRNVFYKGLDQHIDTILCFANVPPPRLKNKARVFILFHNTLLLSGLFSKNGYTFLAKLNFFLKRTYIKKRNRPEYEWLVQTATMKHDLSAAIKTAADKIHVLPFFELDQNQNETDTVSKKDTFLFVADGVPQKNHERLLEAWEYINDEYKVQPELHLTIPFRFANINKKIIRLNKKGCRITNHGVLDKMQLQVLYRQCEYLVFPSLAESFGLPLLEAASNGCKLITSDLPYVFDVVVPDRVFDPYNVRSIAKTVAESIKSETGRVSSIVIKDQVKELAELVTTAGYAVTLNYYN